MSWMDEEQGASCTTANHKLKALAQVNLLSDSEESCEESTLWRGTVK